MRTPTFSHRSSARGRADFAFIEGQDELCQVIEAGDFGAWCIFLQPEQRRHVAKTFSGPFRLFGGAGTGKTVVLIPTIVIESTQCEITYMHATSGSTRLEPR
jgi:hypothetical protein